MQGGSPSGGGKAVLKWGAVNYTVPAAPGGTLSAQASSGVNGAVAIVFVETGWEAPFAGTIRNLMVRTSNAYGAGIGMDYTVYVNEAATGITCNIAGAAQTANSDLANSVAVAQGDRIYVHCDRSAGVPGSMTHRACLELAAA